MDTKNSFPVLLIMTKTFLATWMPGKNSKQRRSLHVIVKNRPLARSPINGWACTCYWRTPPGERMVSSHCLSRNRTVERGPVTSSVFRLKWSLISGHCARVSVFCHTCNSPFNCAQTGPVFGRIIPWQKPRWLWNCAAFNSLVWVLWSGWFILHMICSQCWIASFRNSASRRFLLSARKESHTEGG